jgi:hypothetical protein
VPEPDRHKPWPRPWTWAIVLAVLLFGPHATMCWWGQALVQALFGDIPTPTDAPPSCGRSWGAGSACHTSDAVSQSCPGPLIRRDQRLRKVRLCARRSLHPLDVGRVIGMVEALETLPDLRQSW